MNALQHLVAERQIACQVDRTADVDGRKRLEGGRWLILSARERQLHVAEAVLRERKRNLLTRGIALSNRKTLTVFV